MPINIVDLDKHEPLAEYSWVNDIDRIFIWSKDKSPVMKAFIFDITMSLAYIDATPGIERSLEYCPSLKNEYNFHLGFINLCSPCYVDRNRWIFQKAAKPQSGTIGKISSELILRFLKTGTDDYKNVYAVGGTESIDAVLIRNDGQIIVGEVKSAPLVTFPLLVAIPNATQDDHTKASITASQLRNCKTALYMHGNGIIPLGINGGRNWPFSGVADFVTNPQNSNTLNSMCEFWINSKQSYQNRDRNSPSYYLTNACGRPPIIAREDFEWPTNESISDGKTSAGMDRTDDIKKAIFQTLKLGTLARGQDEIKTAIISNLPAFRHGEEYVTPFIEMLWGYEQDIQELSGRQVMYRRDMKYAFDYIISIIDPIDRAGNG